jgi:CheY-like chemotaxis protein
MDKILLIDDDEFFRSNLRDALIGKGYFVVEANGGNAGIERAKKEMPNVVVTDIVMAEGEGIETIMILRQMAPELPIIAMSGNEEYLRSAGLMGATHMLAKPFRIAELTALLDKVVAGSAETGA